MAVESQFSPRIPIQDQELNVKVSGTFGRVRLWAI
jgi:hypothetical protein